MSLTASAHATLSASYLIPQLRGLLNRTKAVWCSCKTPVRVAVCVSGGPDSMALAYLLKKVELTDATCRNPLDPVAFVVDHGARQGSAAEARKVKGYLSQLGIESLVLRMKWPAATNPSQLSDFESQARVKRYQLIASAALKLGIRDVFVGHHLDDQIETLLLRLMRDQSRSFASLQGISSSSPIPCCDDMFGANKLWNGVSRRNEYNNSEETDGIALRQSFAKPGDLIVKPSRFWPLVVIDGLEMHRPLLGVPKSRILDTCTRYGIPYVTDATNFDPQLTTRNAIRYLRSGYRLPRALETDSLREFHGRARSRMNEIIDRSVAIYQNIVRAKFDLSYGTMSIQLPRLPGGESHNDFPAISYLLARFVENLSPTSSDMSTTFLNNHLTLGLSQRDTRNDSKPAKSTSTPKRLICGKVVFDPVPSSDATASGTTWLLSRQPMRRIEVDKNCRLFSAEKLGNNTSEVGVRSGWLLWDHRFWVRVFCPSMSTLEAVQIRPYLRQDVASVRKAFSTPLDLQKFDGLLHDRAPGHIRFTLPVLALGGDVLAFPSLDILVPSMVRKCQNVRWEVCYPKSFRLAELLEAHDAKDDSNTRVQSP